MSVKDFVQQRRDALIAMRRDFHMYPEPALPAVCFSDWTVLLCWPSSFS